MCLCQCFAVRSLGWVEIPEEDLAPGKSSIAVNNCIQQLSNSKGQGSVENQSEVRAWDSAARQTPTNEDHAGRQERTGIQDQCWWHIKSLHTGHHLVVSSVVV